jgi:hypothetical protein
MKTGTGRTGADAAGRGRNGRGGAACRCGPGFGRSGTMGVDTGRGRCMYEMQRPRPISRHRPADFSASFAPFDHLPGPGTLPVFRSTGSPGGSGTPRAAAQAFLIANGPGFPPSQVAPSSSFTGGSELPFRPMTGVSPKPKAQSIPFRRVAPGFLSRIRLGVSPPPQPEKSSLCRWLRAFFSTKNSGFPLRHAL